MLDPFEEHIEKQKRRRLALEAAPIVTITGLVGAAPAASVWLRGLPESLVFSFAAWRRGSGPLLESKLNVTRELGEQKLDDWKLLIRPFRVLTIKARLLVDHAEFDAVASMISIENGNGYDADLERLSEALQEPVIVDDPLWGLLTLDRRLNWFEGAAEWPSGRAELTISSDGDRPSSAIDVARTVWKDRLEWDRRIRAFAADELLNVRNRTWLEDRESPESRETFMRKLSNPKFTFKNNDEFTCSFDDIDMFAGHSVVVSCRMSTGPIHADIVG